MAQHVEAAFQNRAVAPTPTLRLPHPLTGAPVDYTYDFSATPMMQVGMEPGIGMTPAIHDAEVSPCPKYLVPKLLGASVKLSMGKRR